MKFVFLLLFGSSAFCFAQTAESAAVKKRDSIAVQNVNAVSFFSKKELSQSGNWHRSSEVKRNQQELGRNSINFNPLNGRKISSGQQNFLNGFNANPVQTSGDMLMQIRVYNKK